MVTLMLKQADNITAVMICIRLTVGHDNLVGEWMHLAVLSIARVQFPAMAEYFEWFFPGWSHSANPFWASVAENGSISSQ